MPNAGTRNAEEHVRRLFPLASWHRASFVHRNKAEIAHYFVHIDDASRGEALRQALLHGPPGRTLVFANTVEMAREAFEEACVQIPPPSPCPRLVRCFVGEHGGLARLRGLRPGTGPFLLF